MLAEIFAFAFAFFLMESPYMNPDMEESDLLDGFPNLPSPALSGCSPSRISTSHGAVLPRILSGLGSNTVARFRHGLLDSVYWSFGAVTGMVDKTPRSWGGRIALTGHGWFMMILLASYTANLASFLTTEGLSPVISGESPFRIGS